MNAKGSVQFGTLLPKNWFHLTNKCKWVRPRHSFGWAVSDSLGCDSIAGSIQPQFLSPFLQEIT